MPQLVIADEKYEEAGKAVWSMRLKFEPGLSWKSVENFFRFYVYLGQTKQIKDYQYSLSDADKRTIVQRVANVSQVGFDKAKNLLDFMEILATSGNVSPLIARPRYSQEEFERGYTEATKDNKQFIERVEENVAKVFGFPIRAVGSIFDSLGNFKYVLLGVGVLAALYFLNQLRK